MHNQTLSCQLPTLYEAQFTLLILRGYGEACFGVSTAYECSAWRVQGEIASFDSYHKRSKISYDDGEEMWVALQRETFTWITPRAQGAGMVSVTFACSHIVSP